MDIAYQSRGCVTMLTIAKTEVMKLVVIYVRKQINSGVGTEGVFHSPLFATRITTVATEATKRFAEL